MSHGCFCWPAAALLIAASAPMATSQIERSDDLSLQHPHLMYFSEPVDLSLDTTTIVVRASQGGSLELAMDQAGLQAESVDLGHGDWKRISLPLNHRSSASVTELINSLASDPGVEFVSPQFLDEHGGPMSITPVMHIQFAPEVSRQEALLTLVAEGFEEVILSEPANIPGFYRVKGSFKSGIEVMNKANLLSVRQDVIFAEPDRIITVWGADVIPNDQFFGECWGLHNTGQEIDTWTGVEDVDMNVPQAWDHGTGHPSIIIAVLDNGVEQDHPDINQITPGEDTTLFNGDGGPLFDFDNHGTPVAGCISARLNNSIGGAGVAPNCRTISIKIAYDIDPGSNWTSQDSWVFDGLLAAANRGARITCSSFSRSPSSTVTLGYNALYNAGIMHFASNGNDSDSSINYPASLGVTNAISAINPTGALADFSNFGPGTHFAAPGVVVIAPDRTGFAGYNNTDYTYFGGTSAAAPMAAGAAALAMSADPTLTPETCGALLASTAKDLGPAGYDTQFGNGLPNAHAAVLIANFGDDCPSSGSCVQAGGSPGGCNNASCCYAICDQDPFCCNNWDSFCAQHAATDCFGCGGSGAGSCFVSNGTPSCDDSECCVAVCMLDPHCCESIWDSSCASTAQSGVCGPTNDFCTNATPVGEGSHPFSTVGSGVEATSPIECGFFNNDVWYKHTPDCNGLLTVSTCLTANFDTKIAIYRESALGFICPSSNPIFSGIYMGCNDDGNGCSAGSSLTIEVEAGVAYAIRIGGGEGSGTFSVFCGVPNDICGFTAPLVDGQTEFSTVGATTDGPAHSSCDFCCNDDQIHNDIWYTYTASCDGELTVSTCDDADFDTKLAIYRPTIPGDIGYLCDFSSPITLMACNDDATGCSGFTSSVTAEVEAGSTYRVRVGGYNGASGSGTLHVSCTAPNCPADLNNDDRVDSIDLLDVLADWGFCIGCPTDLNDDNVVNTADLLILLNGWGDCP